MNIEKLPLRYKAFLLLSVVLIILSLGVGYGLGFKQGGEQVGQYVINVALALKEQGFITVDINEEFLKAALFQYNNRVGGCLFTQNKTTWLE